MTPRNLFSVPVFLTAMTRLAILLCAAALAAAPASAPPTGAYTAEGSWHFVSAPRLHPPQVTVNPASSEQPGKLARGDFLLDNFPNLVASGPMFGEGGPLILDSKLQPVWFYPVGTGVASTDLRQQTMDGKPVLSWWQGIVTSSGASTSGQVVVVDQHYHRV